MNSFIYRAKLRHRQAVQLVVVVVALILTAAFHQSVSGQCIDHPQAKTAIRFGNESSFELTFFVDEDETGLVVPSGAVSNEVEIESGEHLVRARAVVRGQSFFVWTINDVPEGQVCTWTITDPSQDRGNPWQVGRNKNMPK